MISTAKKVLADAAARGLTLMTNGEKIVYIGPRDAMTDDLAARLKAHRAELLALLPDESEVSAAEQAPRQPDTAQAPAGDRTGRVMHTNYGTGHPDAKPPEPTPEPTVAWPTDMSVLLRRVAAFFEWTDQDRRDFVAWARRDQQGIDDARQFLEAECAKLPKPDQSERA